MLADPLEVLLPLKDAPGANGLVASDTLLPVDADYSPPVTNTFPLSFEIDTPGSTNLTFIRIFCVCCYRSRSTSCTCAKNNYAATCGSSYCDASTLAATLHHVYPVRLLQH